MIRLQYCTMEYTDWGIMTRFADGTEVGAYPHPEMPHYHVIAHRCGYGDDLMAYCREHEFAHEFVCETLLGTPSRILVTLAAGKMPDPAPSAFEEMAAQQFQRWLRANERPILGGVDWDALKAEALRLLADA